MSASLSPASGVSAWRLAVVGTVAALAVGIGVAAGSFVLANRTVAVGDGAGYVPATAPFYFEMRLEPSTDQDAALRELVGRFPPIEGVDVARPLYEQLTGRLDEALSDGEIDASWSRDVAPWFDGRVGVAVLDLPVEAIAMDPMTEPQAPSMVGLVGVSDADAAAASIERLLATADEPPTFTDQTHAGVTIRVSADDGAYALTDDQLLIAPTAKDIVTALDAHESGSTTLSEVAEITRLTDALPTDWLAFGVYDMSDLMSASLSEAAGAPAGVAEAFSSLLEHQPMRGAFAVTAAGDRISMESVSEPPTGPFAVENADRGLAAEVPADSLYYADGGNLGAALAAFIGPMKEAAATQPEAAEQLEMMEAALGADLEELVSWIGDAALTIGWDGSQPYGGMVLVPTDVGEAQRRLDQLATFAELAAMDATAGITVETDDVGGTEVTTIRWADPNAAVDPMLGEAMSFVVQYAVTDDRALVGMGETFVSRALELGPEEALASDPRFTESVDELGGPSNTGVAWMDLAGTREALEAALGPMLGMMDPSGTYESEVRDWLLPLDQIVAVTRHEGDLWVQRFALLVE